MYFSASPFGSCGLSYSVSLGGFWQYYDSLYNSQIIDTRDTGNIGSYSFTVTATAGTVIDS
jgi:hypothetical protein